MTKESPSSIPGARRAARIAAAAGLAAALAASGAAPAFAADDPAPAPVKPAATSDRGDKLGTADAEILAKAEAKGEKNITMMVATTPGATEQVSKQLDAVEGSVLGQTYDKLGYVRASVPTKSAESTIKAASKLSSVLGIDLKQEIKLDDPTPKGDRADGAKQLKATGSYPAPGKKTPATNPYNPSFETGAVDFVEKHPEADGRGITIGILDSGVDLGHPALRKTTTGERKIVDWVTATDPVSDGDGTWLRMTETVTGPTFTSAGRPTPPRRAATGSPRSPSRPPPAATWRATSTATVTPPTRGACCTTRSPAPRAWT